MAFSYNLDELSENPLYQVRFQIGDTVEAVHEFEDEELQFLLQQNQDSVFNTSVAACDYMLGKLANVVDYKLGPYTESGSDARYNRWLSLKKSLLAAQAIYCAPIAQRPTTKHIFSYDMMSEICCDSGESDE